MKNTFGFILLLISISLLISVINYKSNNTKEVYILENGTKTYVELNDKQQGVYKQYDTVWVNLYNHTVDDTSDNTMRGVLLAQ